MATKPLADFLPQVLPHVEGCSSILARNAILQAAIEFCEKSRVWRHDLDPISVAPNVPEYDLSVSANSYVVDVMRATLGGKPLPPKVRDDLDVEFPGWATKTGPAIGYFLSTDKRKLRIAPVPEAVFANGLLLEAALKPSRAATALEEFLFEEHVLDIAEGAKWKLFSMPNQSWTSASKAETAKDAFFAACGAASAEAASSHSRAPLRTTPYYDLG